MFFPQSEGDPTEKDRDGCGELLGIHVEVVHDAVDLGSRKSRSIDVVENVQNTHDRPERLLASTFQNFNLTYPNCTELT
jgi:hypothetical protein